MSDAERAERYKRAYEAAKTLLWMAEKYAEGGGTHGPEMRDFEEAQRLIAEALEGESEFISL